jgi:hypothetical protein
LEDTGLNEAERLAEIVSATKAYMFSEGILDRTVSVGNKMLEIEDRFYVPSISAESMLENRRAKQIEYDKDEL